MARTAERLKLPPPPLDVLEPVAHGGSAGCTREAGKSPDTCAPNGPRVTGRQLLARGSPALADGLRLHVIGCGPQGPRGVSAVRVVVKVSRGLVHGGAARIVTGEVHAAAVARQQPEKWLLCERPHGPSLLRQILAKLSKAVETAEIARQRDVVACE